MTSRIKIHGRLEIPDCIEETSFTVVSCNDWSGMEPLFSASLSWLDWMDQPPQDCLDHVVILPRSDLDFRYHEAVNFKGRPYHFVSLSIYLGVPDDWAGLYEMPKATADRLKVDHYDHLCFLYLIPDNCFLAPENNRVLKQAKTKDVGVKDPFWEDRLNAARQGIDLATGETRVSQSRSGEGGLSFL